MYERGLTTAVPNVRLALAAGNISSDLDEMKKYFAQNEWQLFDPAWLHGELENLAKDGYANSVASTVAKLVLRNKASAR